MLCLQVWAFLQHFDDVLGQLFNHIDSDAE
jgi:hypothetical protein